MKIKEVSQVTGLTRRTIRYYEAEGLLSPVKTSMNGREYRDYTPENVAELKKIAALRRARFSMEEIHRIRSAPQEIPQVFEAYRQRLQQEQMDLSAILGVVNQISSRELKDEDALVEKVRPVTIGLPLPAVDLDPHFRYLDELEELGNLLPRRAVTPQEQRQKDIAARSAAMFAGFNQQDSASGSNASPGGYGSGFDISNAQKVATYNLILNTRDQDR